MEQNDYIILFFMQLIITFVVTFIVAGLAMYKVLNSLKGNLPNIIKMIGQQVFRYLRSAKGNDAKSDKGNQSPGFMDIIGSIAMSEPGQKMIGGFLQGMMNPKKPPGK